MKCKSINPEYFYSALAIGLKSDIRHKMRDLREYCELVQGTLEPLREKYANMHKVRGDDDPEIIALLNRFSYRRHYERHNNFFVRTLVVELFSTFESIFTEAHNYIVAVNKEQGIVKLPREYKSQPKPITKARDILIQFGFEFDFSKWYSLEQLANTRNILAHAGGSVGKKFERSAKKIIRSTSLIKMSIGDLLIDPAYIEESIILVEDLLLSFHSQVHSKSKAADAELRAEQNVEVSGVSRYQPTLARTEKSRWV